MQFPPTVSLIKSKTFLNNKQKSKYLRKKMFYQRFLRTYAQERDLYLNKKQSDKQILADVANAIKKLGYMELLASIALLFIANFIDYLKIIAVKQILSVKEEKDQNFKTLQFGHQKFSLFENFCSHSFDLQKKFKTIIQISSLIILQYSYTFTLQFISINCQILLIYFFYIIQDIFMGIQPSKWCGTDQRHQMNLQLISDLGKIQQPGSGAIKILNPQSSGHDYGLQFPQPFALPETKLQVIEEIKADGIEIKVKQEIKIDLKEKDNGQVFKKIDILEKQDKTALVYLCNQIISKPPTQQEVTISQKIEKQIQNKLSTKTEKPVDKLMFVLKKQVQNRGGTMQFQPETDFKSQFTLKSLNTGFMDNFIKCRQDVAEGAWKYEDIKNNTYTRGLFMNQYKNSISKEYKILASDVIVNKISPKPNAINIQWTTQQANKIIDKNKSKKRFQIQPFFKHFCLSEKDFDATGDFQFPKENKSVQWRGGWPYYQPVLCRRYGLRVLTKFENDKWITMNNTPGEWAVAFHGVTNPDAPYGNKKVLSNIVDSSLQAGGRQRFCDSKSVNYPLQNVGKGVYCTPHIQVALQYTNPITLPGSDKSYRVVFHCRVNPAKIKVCSEETYWVINDSQNIRPYGIILVCDALPQIEKQFGKRFKYQNYKKDVQTFLSKK